MGLTFTTVFVFDQFEEVFNLPGSLVWTKKFFDWLEEVSSDSCPDEIAKKVRDIIGDKATFPTIKEEKGFKAVFSLRKEFIGELDYWGMQKCFIPSLKDNRYCLKPLTYEGAKKVMTLQERFDKNKVEQILTYFVKQYSREPEKTISEGLPVIPALLLSVVCDSWEKDLNAFAVLSAAEIRKSLNKVLEVFFNQAIDAIVHELSVQDVNVSIDQYRYDLDTALFALVDGHGKRIRMKTVAQSLSQIDFDRKYKQALSNNRIIKVIKVDGEDYVEIIHDSLCTTITKRKELRLAKINLRKNQIRIATCFFVILFLCVSSWFFFYQSARNNLRKEALEIERTKNDSINTLNYNLTVLNKQLELKSDSIRQINLILIKERDSLKICDKKNKQHIQTIITQNRKLDKTIKERDAAKKEKNDILQLTKESQIENIKESLIKNQKREALKDYLNPL